MPHDPGAGVHAVRSSSRDRADVRDEFRVLWTVYALRRAERLDRDRVGRDDLLHSVDQLDVGVFSDWIAALNEDLRTRVVAVPLDRYEPDPESLSGFLCQRIREDFRVVLDAWLATDPIANPEAQATPFDMDTYTMPGAVEAEARRARADHRASEARTANQNGDNYVLTTVLFASLRFFAGVSTKPPARGTGQYC